MTEEENKNVSGNVDDNTQDYLAAIKELKENSVDRSKYESLRAENKKLIESIVNGQAIETNVTQAQKKTVEELRKQLFQEDNTNLQYWTNALELRKTLMENGEADPFLPIGRKIMPTNEDVECANRVAQVVQECIDYAEGDSAVFTNELQRRTIDTSLPKKNKR